MRTLSIALFALALTIGCGEAPEPETETASAPQQPAEVFEVDPENSGTITGRVNFEGEAPQPVRLNMGADAECQKLHDGPVYSEQVVVNENGALQNVFVWVKSGLGDKRFAPPRESVLIDQDGCRYTPHVVGVMTGQTLAVTNSDPTSHNVHPLPRKNNEWNMSQAVGAGAIERSFDKPELMIPVKCNLHPWMRAYVNVSPHPFFDVTEDEGSFTIRGLPPGEYTLEAVHEKFGNKEMQVTVEAGESQQVDFSYSG